MYKCYQPARKREGGGRERDREGGREGGRGRETGKGKNSLKKGREGGKREGREGGQGGREGKTDRGRKKRGEGREGGVVGRARDRILNIGPVSGTFLSTVRENEKNFRGNVCG